MARIGISIEDVKKAVDQLDAGGKSVTADAVRAVLGTGSKTTILGHLQTLRSGKPAPAAIDAPAEALPSGLLAALENAAAAWYADARQRLQDQVEDAELQLRREREELGEVRAEAEQAQRYADQLEQENDRLNTHLAEQTVRNSVLLDQIHELNEEFRKAKTSMQNQYTDSLADLKEAHTESVAQIRAERDACMTKNVEINRRNAVLEEALRKCEEAKAPKQAGLDLAQPKGVAGRPVRPRLKKPR